MTLRINNWSDNFEKADSRRCKEMLWVAVPTKMDGKHFKRLSKRKDGMEIFGAWILLLELAAKMPERGTLKDNDGDLSFEDMELITGFPQKSFKNAISFLSSDEMKWITDDIRRSPGQHPDATQPTDIQTKQNNTLQNNTIHDLPYSEIIHFLNETCNTSFKNNTEKTKSSIKARFKEGYSLEDFKTVILKKQKEWENTKMETFLRPITLFGGKFESYLNQKEALKSENKKKNKREGEYEENLSL